PHGARSVARTHPPAFRLGAAAKRLAAQRRVLKSGLLSARAKAAPRPLRMIEVPVRKPKPKISQRASALSIIKTAAAASRRSTTPAPTNAQIGLARLMTWTTAPAPSAPRADTKRP